MGIGPNVRIRAGTGAATGAGTRIGPSGRIRVQTAAGTVAVIAGATVAATGPTVTGLRTAIGLNGLTAIGLNGRMAAAIEVEIAVEIGAATARMGIGRRMVIVRRVRVKVVSGEAMGTGRRAPAATIVRRSAPTGLRLATVLRAQAAGGIGPSGRVRKVMALRATVRSVRVFLSRLDFAGVSDRPP